MKLVSPQSMMDAAKKEMLNGREPANHNDWCMIVNFFAFNVEPKYAQVAVPVLCKLFDIPLDESEVKQIVTYQVAARI